MSLRARLGAHLPPNVKRAINNARGIETPALVERPEGRRPVVLSPHPDDEVIGCGGTLLKHVAAGEQPTVVHLSSGERSVSSDRDTREREARAAASLLGVEVRFLGWPDGGIGDQDLGPLLCELAPDLVYCPFPFDAHRDHRGAAAALARAAGGAGVERVALYEVWTPLAANTLVDIGAQLDRKLDALRCYSSALASVDYVHTCTGLAAYRSAQGLSGRGYAEAFTVLTVAELCDLLGPR